MKVFTKEELQKCDGSDGVAYIAYNGKVYDVTGSYHWRNGTHHVRHYAGCDLTDAFAQAPHGVELLQRFPVVGVLAK